MSVKPNHFQDWP